MGVVDIDPEVLRRGSIWAQHASEQARRHVVPEYDADTPAIMATLAPEGPYAYVIFPQTRDDGGVALPILTTREEVRQGYELTWAMSRMLDYRPVIELRGAWYRFEEALSHVCMVESGTEMRGEAATLITATHIERPGITGEMVWARKPRAELGTGRPERAPEPAPEGELRRALLELHDHYLASLRRNDVEGMLAAMDEAVQSPVRNYVEDTGALVLLDGIAAHRDHLGAFFAKYEVLSAELLDRIAQEWYLFAELRLTVRDRSGAGEVRAFHTAEIFVPAHDGRFIARIGHGTDPA
jgi:hypothetical protein